MIMNHEDRRALRADLLDQLDTGFYFEQANHSNNFIDFEKSAFVVETALEQWRDNILEPVGEVEEHRILDYIQEGVEWSWITSYENRKFAWCGCFLAYVYKDVIKQEIRYKSFASTLRLRKWAKGTAREIKNFNDIRKGDIVIVGNRKSYGDHICLVEKVEDDLSGVWTVEGNAYGETPQSTTRKEGVIRRFRPRDTIRFIYRPLEQDCNE